MILLLDEIDLLSADMRAVPSDAPSIATYSKSKTQDRLRNKNYFEPFELCRHRLIWDS